MSEDTHTDRDVDRALEAWTPMSPPADFADRVLAARSPLVPQVGRARRVWWIAAPILATAAIAVLVLGTRSMSKSAAPQGAGPQLALERSAGSGQAVAAVAPMAQPGPDAGLAPLPAYEFDVPAVDPTSASSIVLRAGDKATIHVPVDGPVSIDFDFAGQCSEGGAIETALDERYLEKVFVAGRTRATQKLDVGAYVYRLRCRTGETAAEGRIAVVRDDGRRRLAFPQPQNDIDADGRTWRVSFQALIPNIRVRAEGATVLTVGKSGQRSTDIPVRDGYALIPGDQLEEGEYILFPDPVTSAWKKTTLILDFDNTAPQIFIRDIDTSSAGVVIRGEVRVGWSLDVNGQPIDINKFHFNARARFGLNVMHAHHPKYGHHYYLLMPITR
jgi:hypothetical protein